MMENETTTCIHCDSLISAGEIICPVCGKEQRRDHGLCASDR